MEVLIVTIGNEILSGNTLDTNSQWMARELELLGYAVREMKSVRDEDRGIRSALVDAIDMYDFIFLTGGLGPTNDDVTKKTLADFYGLPIEMDGSVYALLDEYVRSRGYDPKNIEIRNQALLPKGAKLFINEHGTACGMMFSDHRRAKVISMPGVPFEMKHLMKDRILPYLKEHYPSDVHIVHRTIHTAGIGESRVAQEIGDIEEKLPDHIDLAYLPSPGQVKVRLSGRGPQYNTLKTELNLYVQEISLRLKDYVYGYDGDSLPAIIGEVLVAKGLKLGCAESCTGGYLSHQITSIPGASSYFEGSIISYSNIVKHHSLAVPLEILKAHGAVSEQTVRHMVLGVLSSLDVDVAISISGIAGPSGGTEEKPVGTIWVCVGNASVQETYLLRLGKKRDINIKFSTTMALFYLYRFISKHY